MCCGRSGSWRRRRNLSFLMSAEAERGFGGAVPGTIEDGGAFFFPGSRGGSQQFRNFLAGFHQKIAGADEGGPRHGFARELDHTAETFFAEILKPRDRLGALAVPQGHSVKVLGAGMARPGRQTGGDGQKIPLGVQAGGPGLKAAESPGRVAGRLVKIFHSSEKSKSPLRSRRHTSRSARSSGPTSDVGQIFLSTPIPRWLKRAGRPPWQESCGWPGLSNRRGG